MSSDNWCSPQVIDDDLGELNDGRPVDCDPCSNGRSLIRARVAYTTGGLILPWNPRRRPNAKTYENPPYSLLGPWTGKGLAELEREDGPTELVRLVPVATSTVWWRRAMLVEPRRRRVPRPAVIFTRRLAFIDEDGSVVNGARFDAALIFYFVHDRRRRVRQALRAFANVTSWHLESA